ncbi:MAG: hypothetical protein AAF203_05230 [Pseudomonadota bacterium]
MKKRRTAILFCLSFFTFNSFLALASPLAKNRPSRISSDIGNGGDLIQCHPLGTLFPYPLNEGWYLLDYAEKRNVRESYLEKETLSEYLEHLGKLIGKADSSLFQSWESFLIEVPFISFESSREHTRNMGRRWVATRRNIIIQDEDVQFLPRNCYRFSGLNKFIFHQLVVRKETTHPLSGEVSIKYSYDDRLLSYIQDRPIQLSMLLLHEWLWDFYPAEEARVLREANRILHSSEAVSMTGSEIRNLIHP